MEYLIKQMMLWFDISEERLVQEKEVYTPIDIMSWDYYKYVKAHPIVKWNAPTYILFAGKDNLQSLNVVKDFADKFHCRLTIAENSEHPYMEKKDAQIVDQWLHDNI